MGLSLKDPERRGDFKERQARHEDLDVKSKWLPCQKAFILRERGVC